MIQPLQNYREAGIDTPTLAQYYLTLACEQLPVVNRVINRYGDLTLIDYLDHLAPPPEPPFQSRDDLLAVVHDYTEALLGPLPAAQVVEDLTHCPMVLTANHHGVDYFAQSIQGTLIFSLKNLAGNTHRKTVPVFSCGNIPLDNLTYPRGILLYRVGVEHFENLPKKLPIFSDRQKRSVVSVAPPMVMDMVQRAESRLTKMVRQDEIAGALEGPLIEIFQKDYEPICRMGLDSYSQQSVLINNRIWKRLFADTRQAPELVYLELEEIVARLLQLDLENSESLARIVLFTPKVWEVVLHALDGEPACWDLHLLEQRLGAVGAEVSTLRAPGGCGSCFFWGVDKVGRKIPLYLENRGRSIPLLRGMDDRGGLWEVPYTPDSVKSALAGKRLLPSLFSCFLALSFSRGLICPGGYLKDEYVPLMQKGLVYALRSIKGHDDVARSVEGISTESYLSGMMPVLAGIEDAYLVPAGPVEIIAGGGLGRAEIDKMMRLTIREAHLAGLFETVQDVVPYNDRPVDWKKQLARDCMDLLGDRIVIK